MKTIYTQGPWQTYGKGGVEPANSPRYELNDGWIIADCPGPDAKANAQLIAAAPEMLVAIKFFVDALGDVPRHVRTKKQQHALNLGLNLITRATGRERGE